MVKCDCGIIFCFNCLEEGHWPARCDQVKWYNDTHGRKHGGNPKDANDKTLKWLQKYTQDCARCKSPIEKNGGCNHMNCKTCGYSFCWVCQGPWTGGSHYNCTAPSLAGPRDLSRFFESTLTFSQLYSLHEASRIHDDARIKRIAIQNVHAYLQCVPDSTAQDVSVIIQGIEYIFLVTKSI